MDARGVSVGEKRTREVREVQAARQRYEQALQEGGVISRKSVSEGFEDSRQKTFQEFVEFLGSVGCENVREASGADVIAFVQGWWLVSHRGNFRTQAPGSSEKVASVSAVKGVITQIAKSYSMLGVCDDQNPAKTEAVRSYREGYRVMLREQGVREKRAKIMPEEKVTALVEYLNGEVRWAQGTVKCCAAMDRAIVLYLWETWARWSKTVREEPSAEIRVSGSGGENTFLWAAGLLHHEMEVCGHAAGSEFLFRPLNKQRNGFGTTALSAGAMNRRVQRHLQRAGLFEGETLHSFRRSAVQHAAELENYNVARLMELGRWKSRAAFRVYVEEIAGEFARGSL
ncbi:putative DNA breaking-rejoining enzymes [Klebsormidium nitens]|uniref:Putative DNA breaking-rejoining enzymes n=1 Tax=Klebsormidium nitens TaxID=105231 RepID=A0A1Y1IVR1_KLENI|nr:putative DNA breaking-rejoining enzymes [Klebsormidium nitens]|eukprot:GAQ93491.1 putative DNA breaking-rejoining enzymes [Klebsormidium nitens]